MSSVLYLPLETILHISQYLDVEETVAFGSTCRHLYTALQLDQFFWLRENFPNSSSNVQEKLGSISKRVLSLYLLFILGQTDPDEEIMLDDARRLIEVGASLSYVSYGSTLYHELHENGESNIVNFMLENNATLRCLPGGIGAWLEDKLENPSEDSSDSDAARYSLDFLFQHGATLGDLKDPQGLLERIICQGETYEVDLLLNYGITLSRVPDGIDELYDEISRHYGTMRDADALEKVLFALQQLEGSFPEKITEELHRIYSMHGRGPLELILEAKPTWSMQDGSNRLDDLLSDAAQESDVQGMVFLLRQGASLARIEPDWTADILLYKTISQIGVGSDADFLHDKYKASPEIWPGAVQELLEEKYVSQGPSFTVDCLIRVWKANLAEVPCGLPALLEKTVLQQGPDSPGVKFLLEEYNLNLDDVPCGLTHLLTGVVRGPGNIYERCNSLLASLGKKVNIDALDSMLEAAFRRTGPSMLTDQIIESGASLKRVPHGIGALLEYELVHSDRAKTKDTLRNAEYLLARGASLQDLPSGSATVLKQVLDRFGDGPRAEWLLKHGVVAEKPTE